MEVCGSVSDKPINSKRYDNTLLTCSQGFYRLVKELHPRTQETRQTCGGQTCPLSCVMLNLSINFRGTKVYIIFHINKYFSKNFQKILYLYIYKEVETFSAKCFNALIGEVTFLLQSNIFVTFCYFLAHPTCGHIGGVP